MNDAALSPYARWTGEAMLNDIDYALLPLAAGMASPDETDAASGLTHRQTMNAKVCEALRGRARTVTEVSANHAIVLYRAESKDIEPLLDRLLAADPQKSQAEGRLQFSSAAVNQVTAAPLVRSLSEHCKEYRYHPPRPQNPVFDALDPAICQAIQTITESVIDEWGKPGMTLAEARDAFQDYLQARAMRCANPVALHDSEDYRGFYEALSACEWTLGRGAEAAVMAHWPPETDHADPVLGPGRAPRLEWTSLTALNEPILHHARHHLVQDPLVLETDVLGNESNTRPSPRGPSLA